MSPHQDIVIPSQFLARDLLFTLERRNAIRAKVAASRHAHRRTRNLLSLAEKSVGGN